MSLRAFVWKRVENATEAWHSEAGILAVASDLAAAREAIAAKTSAEEPCEALSVAPDLEFEAVGVLPFVHVFPDAGCC